MKKAVSFILALILVSMLLLPVGAEENASSMLVTKGALTYAIDDNFTIVACDPAVHVKDCTLPGIIDGYKVVRIGKDAFKDCTLLTDIKILEETTDIDEGAFSGCTALTKIFIPSSMVSIGEGAFSRCTNLTDVYYAGTEEQRGGITLGAGNDSFLSATWHYNYDYERPNLPDDMIGKEGLLIYTVNDDGTSCAIRDCEESVSGTYEIPEEIDGYKVTKIKNVAFYECSTLAKLVIPSEVKYIGDSAFDGCTALTEVNIPQNVSYIGPSAFNNCTSLKNITIPDGIQDIDYFSFSGCDSLQSVTLSTSVTEIEDGAFSGCPNLTYVYYAGTEEQKNTIYFGSDNEDILTATWIYESDTPDEQKFTVGRDDFSFLNEEKYFFDEEELRQAKRAGLAAQLFRKGMVPDTVSNELNYYIPEEDFEKLTRGMSNTVKNEVIALEMKKWGGSCYGMVRVAAIRYLDKTRLPLTAISPELLEENVTFDLKEPAQDMNVRNLINYYQLAQVLPLEKALEREECENRIKTDYLGAINDIVTAVKNEKCVQVTAGQSQAKGSHALLLIGINKETEDFVDMQVWDPNQVEIKSLYMYKDKGNIEDAIRISTDAYGDRLDRLYQWFSGIDNIDTRNYFGVDDHEVFSDYSDYEKAYLQIKSGTQISFSSGNARLEYSDGEVKSSNNVSGPYSLRSDGDNDDGEIEFCIEKQQLGKDGFCSVSNDAGGNELTIINDGWSVSIVSDKPIQISMDNTEQSVKIQSEEKGLLSAWLTQNTPSANSAWYGTAVDVNDAKELILTPTSEGVKVNSDNMQDARVTVNGDGTFASKAINTTKNEILVQEDADATIGDCIKIQGTYTIRASVGLHGTISPAGYVAVDAGGTQTFTFTPDEGYTVEHVKVNGKNKGEITDYTFKKVKKDQEIEVTFREKTEQDSEPKEKSGYGPILDWILSIIEWIKHWFQA